METIQQLALNNANRFINAISHPVRERIIEVVRANEGCNRVFLHSQLKGTGITKEYLTQFMSKLVDVGVITKQRNPGKENEVMYFVNQDVLDSGIAALMHFKEKE